jgi:uncharacterized protein (DUF433 family)
VSSACFSGAGNMAQLYKGSYKSGVDSRELPLYTPADAACYLGIHPNTLHPWLWGRVYPMPSGRVPFKALIKPADPAEKLLSFYNLAELHVLAATRYKHKVPFKAVRSAMDTIQQKYPSEHPLLTKDFLTNGSALFAKSVGEIENLSQPLQLNFKEIMDLFVERVISDDDELVKKIYPLIAGQPNDKVISITYGISSSQPAVDGFGVPVWLIHNRYEAGEEAESIADDFKIPVQKVLRAIDYFEKRAA